MRGGRAVVAFSVVFASLWLVWGRLVDSFVFHPSPGVDLRPEQVGLVGGEEVFLDTEDGVRIHAFWLPAPGAERAILYLHGNAGNASHRLPIAAELVAQGASVLLLDYRGYGRSEGRPSEAGVYADARAALDHLLRQRGLDEPRIVVFGSSLGGAVAVDLARDRALGGVILESTFTSLAEMAKSVLPIAAPFVGGRFDSAAKIGGVSAPLLVVHGERDEIVPFRLGRALFELAPEPKAFVALPGAGHNDTYEAGGRAYFARIRRFLDEVTPPEPKSGATDDADTARGAARVSARRTARAPA